MRIFIDNCISPVIADAIKVLAEVQQYEIIHLRDRFPVNTPDSQWLGELGLEGDWIVVSADPRISRGKAEKAAWHESGLTAFFLAKGWANQKFWKQAAHLVKWWPEIVLEARDTAPGTGYEIPLRGSQFRTIYAPR